MEDLGVNVKNSDVVALACGLCLLVPSIFTTCSTGISTDSKKPLGRVVGDGGRGASSGGVVVPSFAYEWRPE